MGATAKRLAASTGPPSIEGGKAVSGRVLWVIEALQRGRPQSRAESRPRLQARRRDPTLQRGRPQSRAERPGCAAGDRHAASFNGAALNRGRKAKIVLRGLVGAVASTGPPSIEGGKRSSSERDR
ncbi:Periplasmic thiol disulfide interchange protein DsbA [Enhygromyxa salina]|uniref:Periplasmic thiol disulfide interchange protein DsbA n=1 Tax=Enhygromyxa salina TaxID=215803 RepID=A0A0C2DGX9_9BACT|nr:Periplasmic thiol disulfide interchange protein DsbA [Enhygromyxa salina]